MQYLLDGWWNTKHCFRATDNMTANDILLEEYPWVNKTKDGITKLVRKSNTPVEEFWEYVQFNNSGLAFNWVIIITGTVSSK